MRTILEKMIVGLRKQVEEKLPEKGKFDVIYEREEVKGVYAGLSHVILKVSVPKYLGDEDLRYLELGAVNYPFPYGAECTMGCGSTQEILALLQEDGLVDKLFSKLKDLADDIDYEERHPYG